MTNYTQDLLFSMERLSQNPYPLRLVKPTDTLPFQVPEDLTMKISGVSLEALKTRESLFLVDRKWLDQDVLRAHPNLKQTAIKPSMRKLP